MAEQCFKYPRVTREEHQALRALNKGIANDYQQRLALSVITNKFARAHDVLFIPGKSDETAFLAGRSFVGSQVLKHLNIPVGQLSEDDPNDIET